MAEKHENCDEIAETQQPPFVVPRIRPTAYRFEDGRQPTAHLIQQWQNFYDEQNPRIDVQMRQSPPYYITDNTGCQHGVPPQDVWSPEDGVHQVIPQSPPNGVAPFLPVHQGQVVAGGPSPFQPEMFYQMQEPNQPYYIPQESWTSGEGGQEAPQQSTAAVGPQVLVHAGQPPFGAEQPMFFRPPNGEPGFQLPTYPQQTPLQENGPQEVVFHPPGTTMPQTVVFPGPSDGRGPPMCLVRVPVGGNPPNVTFHRTRSYGPCHVQLVCPFCAQQIRYEVRTIENVHTWNYFMGRNSRIFGRHYLSWRISTSDVDHRCPNCKRHLGTYIRNPNNWCR